MVTRGKWVYGPIGSFPFIWGAPFSTEPMGERLVFPQANPYIFGRLKGGPTPKSSAAFSPLKKAAVYKVCAAEI